MDVKCINEVGHDTNIRLTDEIGMIMDYPKVDSVQSLNLDDEVESMFLLSKPVSDRYMTVTMCTKRLIWQKKI